jgi:wobble nucleotide-excising tRNase
MAQTLRQIAQSLKDSDKKVQLIYAFNGIGKTRLSKEFKELIAPKEDCEEGDDPTKIIYYNAFTEDLFYWDNDLENDDEIKLKIHSNSFTKWVLKQQGQDLNIIGNFQDFSGSKITPKFSSDFLEVTFTLEGQSHIKISRGEESNFIWSFFYILLKELINELNIPASEYDDNNPFRKLKYIFIDDPVSSLDENHLIELAVNLSTLIKLALKSTNLKFIISTHNPLFYNVLSNELKNKSSYMLSKLEDGTFELNSKKGGSNTSFSYHLYLRDTIQNAIDNSEISKYHFVLLRNLYEKTANFLGYKNWTELLPVDGRENYMKRIMHFYSHSSLSSEQIAEPTDPEKQTVKLLFNHLINESKYCK